jgi:hypothetical protein
MSMSRANFGKQTFGGKRKPAFGSFKTKLKLSVKKKKVDPPEPPRRVRKPRRPKRMFK